MGTFSGGIHPPVSKKATSDKPIKGGPLPRKVSIPLLQHTGNPAKAKISAGDIVSKGQLIGEAQGFISSSVHASISGKVLSIEHGVHPILGRSECVVIESDGKDAPYEAGPSSAEKVKGLSGNELIEIVRSSGIVGMGGAAFPTHVKLTLPKEKVIDSVILNGAECEPYLTCDNRLMIERAPEIIKGLGITLEILSAKKAFIAIEDNKLSASRAMERALEGSRVPRTAHFVRVRGRQGQGANIKVVTLKTKYPQGAEKQTIKAVLNRTVPDGGLPMDVGCVVQNVGTAFAIYEAVYLGKPLIERCVTVTGSAVKEPVNLWVRIGTLFSDLKEAFGGFAEAPRKIISGGPMMGLAQYTIDFPIIKGTSGIVCMSGAESGERIENPCIRCGRCIEACPMGLMPASIMSRVRKEFYQEAKELGIESCYECGACAWACPAKIPIVDYIKFGKSKILLKKP